MHGGRMRHLLPSVSEGVPAEGVLRRALQLRRRLHARARREHVFCPQRQERQRQDRAAVQLRVAGEFTSRPCVLVSEVWMVVLLQPDVELFESELN